MGTKWLRSVLLGLLVCVSGGLPASAQPASAPTATGERGGLLAMLPQAAITHHTILVEGKRINYLAEAGSLPLRDGQGQTTAAVFYVSYMADPTQAERPITFVFNGGPGAAAAYLQLGGLGPRILELTPAGNVLPPPVHLIDNPDSWIDRTDLVFVDPVGTGYSRAADPAKESELWGVEQDANAAAAFIRLYLQRAGRRLSPVYLVGESYGGFRVALLARRLSAESGITVSGAVLISPALEFSLLQGEDFDPLQWALSLPSLAAVNLERQGVAGRAALRERLAAVEKYALTDYLVALASGLEAGGRVVSREVARLTGLPVELVERRYGRIPTAVFIKEYDRAAGRYLSRYDGAVGAPDPRPDSSLSSGPDPVLDRLNPALTTGFVHYVREELGYKTDITYRVLNTEISRRWDYGTTPSRQGFAGVAEDLQEARSLNPSMGVLIAHGYTDLATPYFAAQFLVGQMPALRGAAPIRLETYEGGHMMYLRQDSRRALREDAMALYGTALLSADPSAP
jgi:carboxypeptidase C (cathepsin A)